MSTLAGKITDSYNAALITHKFTVTLYWEVMSQSFLNNHSVVKYRLGCTRQGGNPGWADWTITINGTEYTGSYKADISTNSEVNITSGTITIPHNSDGTKSFNLSFSYKISSISKASASGTGTIDKIPRPASITSGQDFNDEQNPIIYYTNPAGTVLTALDACISFDGSKDDIPYRPINMNAGSYTFELTDTERATIWAYLNNRTKGTVRFYVRSKYNGEVVHSYKIYNLSLINATPTYSPQYYDVNSATVSLTGDRNTLIKYHSTLYVDVGAHAKKGASITSYKITNGSEIKTTNPAYFYDVESPDITFSATDSRGLSDTRTVSRKFVNYIHPSCRISITPPGTDGLVRFNVWGNCFYGYFGDHDDSLYNETTIDYRYVSSDGEVGDWEYSYVNVLPNNTYNESFEVTVPDYTKAYTIEVVVNDMLESASTDVTVRAQTVFDWDANDFNFNVPVHFNSGFTVPNRAAKRLWNGQAKLYSSSGTQGDDTIGLIEPVSAQANGIVLIFTPYNASTGVANDAKLQAFFIPKMAVFAMPNKMHTFQLVDGSNFAKIGAKSVYIGDERISGYANNSNKGTANGITYDNTAFCLRYIIGV